MAKKRASFALPGSFKQRSTSGGGGKVVKKSGGNKKKSTRPITVRPSTVLRMKKK